MRYKVHGWVRLKAETESRALISTTQTTAVSENALSIEHHTLCNEVKFLERVPHGYASRSKEAIPKRLHLDSISIDSG